MGQLSNNATYATSLGPNWRTTYDRYLNVSGAFASAERADGQVLTFTLSSSAWSSDTDVDYTLAQSGSAWTLSDHDDAVETYTVSSGKGTLDSIKLRNGYAQSLTYSNGLLSSVNDSYNCSLSFSYTGSLLDKVTTPDNSVTCGFNGNGVLSTVTYSTTPTTILTYDYENTNFPYALTGITDENGNRYATWVYDSFGRATSNQMGGALAANLTTLSYGTGTTTVTNTFGVADSYTFATLQGVPKVTSISDGGSNTYVYASITRQPVPIHSDWPSGQMSSLRPRLKWLFPESVATASRLRPRCILLWH